MTVKRDGDPEIYGAFVPNMAALDGFIAPDSTARRPDAINPHVSADRKRRANQTYDSAIEADLNDGETIPATGTYKIRL